MQKLYADNTPNANEKSASPSSEASIHIAAVAEPVAANANANMINTTNIALIQSQPTQHFMRAVIINADELNLSPACVKIEAMLA